MSQDFKEYNVPTKGPYTSDMANFAFLKLLCFESVMYHTEIRDEHKIVAQLWLWWQFFEELCCGCGVHFQKFWLLFGFLVMTPILTLILW